MSNIPVEHLLNAQSKSHQRLFAALLGKNAIVGYQYFTQAENWGDLSVLIKSTDLMFESILNDDGDNILDTFNSLINAINMITPDLDDFGPRASYALDACCVHIESLLFIKNGDLKHVVNASKYIFDMIDMYIQEKEGILPDDDAMETKINEDFYMRKEKKRQMSLLEGINTIGEIDSVKLKRILEMNDGFGNIIDVEKLPY
jgi:uncharacterized protein YjaG (DUF416 family)